MGKYAPANYTHTKLLPRLVIFMPENGYELKTLL